MKYQPLGKHLAGVGTKFCTLTFGEVERIIGSELPDSAWTYRPWWANDQYHVQSKAWMDAGWRVASVDQQQGRVQFERG